MSQAELPVADDMAADGRAGAGSERFGELDLGDGDGGTEQKGGGAGADGSEFDIPQEEAAAAAARADAMGATFPGAAADVQRFGRGQAAVQSAVDIKPKRRIRIRPIYVVLSLLVIVVGGGVVVRFVTPHGWFGFYYLEQVLPGSGNADVVDRTIATAEQTASSDTYVDSRASLRLLSKTRNDSGSNRRLWTRSLLMMSLHQIRFGEDNSSTRSSAGILQRLADRSFVAPDVELARAADSLRRGRRPEARRFLGEARGRDGDDVHFHLLMGELELQDGHLAEARAAFQQALGRKGGGRAAWGIARVLLRGSDNQAIRAAIDATLQASPQHSAARIAKGQLVWRDGDAATAITLVRQAAGAAKVNNQRLRSSPGERADAWTLLGQIYVARDNRADATAAFEAALAVDPYRIDALLGAGRALLKQEHYRRALGRFRSARDSSEAATFRTGGPRSAVAEAKLGEAQALLGMEQAPEAQRILEQLNREVSNDPEINLWLGRALQTQRNFEGAEQQFRASVQAAPERFESYMALAELFFELERPSDAEAVLVDAQTHVPESSQVVRMRGNAALAMNRLDEAQRQFQRALELDPEDSQALFLLGIAQRRAHLFEEAAATFARVGERDPAWPGLAIEQGQVFEGQGQSDRAAEAYRQALTQRPNDADLLLRLATAQVNAGTFDEAEQTLRKVMEERPNSADGIYLQGRVAYGRGDLPESLVHFDRAIDLNPEPAEFHLYMGWAALKTNRLQNAITSAEAAIERDPSLADAYWLRGSIRLRIPQVRDARDDLLRALQLSPNNFEIYADLGDVYDNMRRLPEAIRAYTYAVERDDTRSLWWYRLGRLSMDAGNREQAAQALARATFLGSTPPHPVWLANAHRELAEALELGRERAGAIEHYRRFLELAPANSDDRAGVIRRLEELGVDPDTLR